MNSLLCWGVCEAWAPLFHGDTGVSRGSTSTALLSRCHYCSSILRVAIRAQWPSLPSKARNAPVKASEALIKSSPKRGRLGVAWWPWNSRISGSGGKAWSSWPLTLSPAMKDLCYSLLTGKHPASTLPQRQGAHSSSMEPWFWREAIHIVGSLPLVGLQIYGVKVITGNGGCFQDSIFY